MELLRRGTGCGIQHKGCPCRTCFYNFAENVLGLKEKRATDFWRVVLILRGDYDEKGMAKTEAEELEKCLMEALKQTGRKIVKKKKK